MTAREPQGAECSFLFFPLLYFVHIYANIYKCGPINFYRTESGDCPVEEFLDSLSGKQAQKVAWVLRLIEELDLVPGQYFEKLVNTEDIWEVRIQFGGDIFRLLGFFAGSAVLILTNGFAKKSQKTPRQEIELATRRKNEYLSRQRKQ